MNMSEISKPIIEALVPLVIAAITALLGFATQWVRRKIQETNTNESAAWYKTALVLAGAAVKFAEVKFGPDTATGEKKKQEATDWLMARFQAMDSKVKIDRATVAALIDAAYADVFLALSPLAPGQASEVPITK